jgi:capsular exopolysaccharide synthesis family protein
MKENTIIIPPNPLSNGEGANYRLTMMVPKRRYLSFLRERWWIPMVCVMLTMGGVLTYETLREGNYISYAQLYVVGDTRVNNVASLLNEESLTYFGTQMELLKSSRVQTAAYQKAGITMEPGKNPPLEFEVVQPLKTSILRLQASGPDPVKVRAYLQGVVDEYLSYKKETRKATSEDIVVSLTDQLSARETALREAQGKWADFQRTNNVAVLEEEGKSDGLYLSDLNLQLAKLKLEEESLTNGLAVAPGVALTNAVEPGGTQSNSINASLAERDTMLKQARVDLAVTRAEKEMAPGGMMRRYDDSIARLEKTVSILEKEDLSEKQSQFEESEREIRAIKGAIPSLEKKLLDINQGLSEVQVLKDNIAREQGYYDHLLGTLQNVDLSKDVEQERLSVLLPATAAEAEKRHLILRTAASVIGGLVLGLGFNFAWYLLDDRFVSFRDIKDQYGETLLGLVPQIKVSRRKPQQALLSNADTRHGYLESYRHLRSALLLSSFGESRPQTLLFTSTAASEGKTTIAANLARLLARSGLRVVLVDADARGGGLKHLLGDNDKPGVLDYLRGEAGAQAVAHPTEIEGLSYVAGGTHKEHSEGLFLHTRLGDLIRELRRNCDFVVVDSPPILASDDAAMLVPHADAIVLVTRPFHTRSQMMRQALDMLYQRQAKQVSIILNRARADDVAGHYAMNGMAAATRNGKG